MRQRIVSLVLEIGWMVPWLIALGAGASWWVPILSGLALVVISTSRRRGTFGPLAVLAGVAIGYLMGSGFGAVAAGIGAWRGWAAHGRPTRSGLLGRLVVVLIALSALVIWHPSWWPVLPASLILAVAGMAEASRPPGVGSEEWWSLGSAFGLVSLGAALVVYGLAFWGPWKHLAGPLNAVLAFAIGLISDTIVRLLSRIHFHGHLHIPKIQRSSANAHRPPPPRLVAGHHLVWVILIAVVGAIVVTLGVWWISRALANWNPKPAEDEERLERRRVGDPYRGHPGRVRFTRRVVRVRLKSAVRRQKGASPNETLREWFRRVHHEVPSPVTLYEEVRYGGVRDTAERARRTHRQWPPEPQPPPKG
ncbi:MAG: DUF4129 domain-containing protein [Firmicutes bacterium]|nr:DUF4129 domain-containing protein [Bacillota bacterium]